MAIVIDPEVDVWIWGADNALREVLQWPLEGSIRAWLQSQGFAFGADDKPERPKEALEAMVPVHRQPRSTKRSRAGSASRSAPTRRS